MLKAVTPGAARILLTDLGAVRVQGPDAVKFLQGQVSNDVSRLAAGQSMLAGLHNPQGRVIALLRLLHLSAEDVLAVLPRELAAPVAARLAKFVLRAKVKVWDASSEWMIAGISAADGAESRPADESASARRDEEILFKLGDTPFRWLAVSSQASLSARAGASSEGDRHTADTASREQWHALDIAAGMPQVYAATSEQFVAQMLNMDVVDAISFTKGCYTGQEVIARAHYRGRVKRRMQRFRSLEPVKLAPGDSGRLRDGRSFRVVDAVTLSDGRSEFLAVAPMSAATDEPQDQSAATADHPLEVEPLPLPYALPE